MCWHGTCLLIPVWSWSQELGRAKEKLLGLVLRKDQILTTRYHCLCPWAVPRGRSRHPHWGFGLCHELSWSWWSLGRESPNIATLQVKSSLRTQGAVETVTGGTPLLPTHPAKAHLIQNTCVEGSSKDPALAVSDRSEARSLPLLEDFHAAIPVPRIPATSVATAPVPRNHATVIIAIDLGRNKPQRNQHREWQAEFRGQGKELKKEARETLSSLSVFLGHLDNNCDNGYQEVYEFESAFLNRPCLPLIHMSFPAHRENEGSMACQWWSRGRKSAHSQFLARTCRLLPPDLKIHSLKLSFGVLVF